MRHIFTIDCPINAHPPESKVWFYLDVRSGSLIRLEEHDNYSGGQISDEDSDIEALFLQRVTMRGGNAMEAQQFLDTLEIKP